MLLRVLLFAGTLGLLGTWACVGEPAIEQGYVDGAIYNV